MKIEDYLADKQRNLAKSTGRIRDYRVFDFNYIPENPLMREEVKPVIDALLRYRQTGIANNVLILGSRGSGKSVTARYLMTLLAQQGELHFAYANCRQHNTSFKILASLLGLRPRGCSLDELWQWFTVAHQDKTVFVLDEVDLMSDKDKYKDILYLVSRSDRNYMAILLSNNPKFLNSLDESIKSTLQPELVLFRNYNAVEIETILSDRARAGLTVLPERITREIAAMTVRDTHSDVRVAIKTLYLWALEPHTTLKDHFEKARRDIVCDVVQDLNDKNLLILRAVQITPNGYVKDIYETYRRISIQVSEEPFSYMHFYSNLSYLQSLGLILMMSTKIKQTYTNRIQLTFDTDILTAVWRMRFD